jgi:4'-phosphopantetheinyl transferase
MTRPPGPADGDVHAWHGRIDRPPDPAAPPRPADLAVLSEDERARCERFVRPADRVRFAAMHAAVRGVLAAYLGVRAADLRFGRRPCCECAGTEHGPPRIDWPATSLMFNLSGSDDHWLLAVARERPVGADIEVPRDLDVGAVAAAVLTESERDYLGGQPDAGRRLLFYRCWTRKEAVLKACGVGLAGSMRSLDAAPASSGPVELQYSCRGGPGRWAVADLTDGGTAGPPGSRAGPGWLGAVAQPAAGAGQIALLDAAEYC